MVQALEEGSVVVLEEVTDEDSEIGSFLIIRIIQFNNIQQKMKKSILNQKWMH